MTKLQRQGIYVADSIIHGRGVYAAHDIAPQETIEECHFITIPDNTVPVLCDYTFNLTGSDKELRVGCVFGYASIYNHADDPNTTYHFDEEKSLLRFVATRHIEAGEEILINYGEKWLISRNAQPLQRSFWFRCRMFLRKYRRLLRHILLTVAIIQLLYLMQG